MLPAWPLGFLPGFLEVLYVIFLGSTLSIRAFGDDYKSMFLPSGLPYWSAPRLA